MLVLQFTFIFLPTMIKILVEGWFSGLLCVKEHKCTSYTKGTKQFKGSPINKKLISFKFPLYQFESYFYHSSDMWLEVSTSTSFWWLSLLKGDANLSKNIELSSGGSKLFAKCCRAVKSHIFKIAVYSENIRTSWCNLILQ